MHEMVLQTCWEEQQYIMVAYKAECDFPNDRQIVLSICTNSMDFCYFILLL